MVGEIYDSMKLEADPGYMSLTETRTGRTYVMGIKTTRAGI